MGEFSTALCGLPDGRRPRFVYEEEQEHAHEAINIHRVSVRSIGRKETPYAGGHVIGAEGRANFGGHLAVGDSSGSLFVEMGNQGVGLLNPFGAEVWLMAHVHGPAASGQVLKAQISSFLGGCQTFLGPDGVADGPEDVPDAVGECSTVQFSIHQ